MDESRAKYVLMIPIPSAQQENEIPPGVCPSTAQLVPWRKPWLQKKNEGRKRGSRNRRDGCWQKEGVQGKVKWRHLYMRVMSSLVASSKDQAGVYVWHAGPSALWVLTEHGSQFLRGRTAERELKETSDKDMPTHIHLLCSLSPASEIPIRTLHRKAPSLPFCCLSLLLSFVLLSISPFVCPMVTHYSLLMFIEHRV